MGVVADVIGPTVGKLGSGYKAIFINKIWARLTGNDKL